MKQDDITRVFLTALILVFLTIPFANADYGNETGLAAETPYETEDASGGIQSILRENGTGQFNETPAPVPYIYVPYPVVEPGKSLGGAAENTAAESYEYVGQWGTYGSGNGQFHYPAGLLVDKTGKVYVADHYGARVQKFSPDGTYITQLGTGTYGSGDGQMHNPWGMAEDISHDIYVTDAGDNCRVQKYDADGTFITQWGTRGTGTGQFYFPSGVASDSSGKVYVAGYENQRIQVFSSDGFYETSWGSYGTGDGQFNHLHGVAIDASDNVYIVDFNNNRIQKFRKTGEYITKWGSYGSDNGQFNGPIGIGLDTAGNVYVADTYNHRIQKFDSNGTYITQWGTYGTGVGQFSRPHGVGVDASGMVYVTDFDNHRVQVFRQLDPLTADFTGYPTNGTAPLTVYFNDTSTGRPTSWTWSFGDGQYSTNRNCSHTYTSQGNYTVNLTTANLGGRGTITKAGFVTVSRLGPAADFTASPTSGAAQLRVQFTDASTGQPPPTVVLWDFGDGETSATKNPSHLYTSPGTYTVNLTVKNKKGFDTETKEGYVEVTEPIQTTFYVFADGVSQYHNFENNADLFRSSTTSTEFYTNITGKQGDPYSSIHWEGIGNPVDDATGSKNWNINEDANTMANNADFALHAGHGWNEGILFGTANTDYKLFRANNLSFGGNNRKAKWVAFFSCSVLNEGNWQNWKSVFNGLHILMGFDTIGVEGAEQGSQFAQRMTGDGLYSAPFSIRDAWRETLQDTIEDDSVKGAYMWADPSGDDYLAGFGTFREPVNDGNGIHWENFICKNV
jgi:PKD repeat protein